MACKRHQESLSRGRRQLGFMVVFLVQQEVVVELACVSAVSFDATLQVL